MSQRMLSPKELAHAIGVSESSVKRWADDGRIEVSRTAGGHRRIPVEAAVRFVRESRAPVLHPEVLGMPEIRDDAAAPGDRDEDALYEYLRSGQTARARGWLLSRYLAGESIAAIFDGPFCEALTKLGQLYVEDPEGIFVEHRATDISLQVLRRLRSLIPPKEGAHTAIGGAVPGDIYLIPTLMAAIVLQGEGYRTVNLGPDTAISALRSAVAREQPEIVWLSASVVTDGERLSREVEELGRALATKGIRLIVGGRARKKLALSASDHVYVGERMAELSAFAKALHTSAGSPAGSA